MNRPVVSIIIPVYNAAVFVEQCVSSILQQTLINIEVIAINDGSTDESGLILDRLAVTDARLRVFHRTNAGVSATRNFGLQQACGAYIGFVDADDYVDPEMYASLINIIRQNKCEWAICNVHLVRADHPVSTRLVLKNELIDLQVHRSEVLQNLLQFVYDNANWNKLYNAGIIRNHQVLFDEQLDIGEDLLFNLHYLAFANGLVVIDEPYYFYRVHSGSVMSRAADYPVSQFVYLVDAFHRFSAATIGVQERMIFSKEITRIVYYQLVNQLRQEAERKSSNFLDFVFYFRRLLFGLQSIELVFTSNELRGFGGFKKWLLQRKQYFIFSVISLFRKTEVTNG